MPPTFTSVDQAQARLAELKASQDWVAKVLSNDPSALREFRAITEMIGKSDRVDAALAGKPILDGELTAHDLVGAIGGLRELGLRDEVVAEALRGSINTADVVRQTRALYQDRMSDPEWTERLLAGGAAEKREHALMSIILSGQMTG